MELVTKLGRSQYGVPSANTVFRSFRSGSLVLVSHFWRGVTEQKNRSASSRFLGNLSWSQDTNTRKPTHGNYRFLPHPATELRSSFHGPDLPDIRGDRHGLDHLSASPLRDRSHLLQWPCRRRGLTLYGAGMHYDPLISSRAKSLVSWGHDWVVLTLIVAFPAWAPSKV